VRWHGKPLRAIYDRCLSLAPEARRPLAIGDSLYHDIGGARGAGIDSLLIAGGIHYAEFGIRRGEAPTPERLAEVCRREGQYPDYVLPVLRW
jgi:ribonucleotide monophosphatase NagD (HAD superfamily)